MAEIDIAELKAAVLAAETLAMRTMPMQMSRPGRMALELIGRVERAEAVADAAIAMENAYTLSTDQADTYTWLAKSQKAGQAYRKAVKAYLAAKNTPTVG